MAFNQNLKKKTYEAMEWDGAGENESFGVSQKQEQKKYAKALQFYLTNEKN